MSSEILRGDRAEAGEPVPWLTVCETAAAMPAGLYDPAPARSGEKEAESAAELEAQLAQMQAAADRAAREAREAGRREGEAAGRKAAQQEVARAVEDLGAAIRQVSELRPRLRMDAEADLVRLALEIARRIVRRELTIDPEAIAGLARTALERLRLQETVSVRVHPQFQESVRQYLAHAPGAAHVEVTADPTLDRGALVFETARGRLDASAETQLREIESGLTDRLRGYGA